MTILYAYTHSVMVFVLFLYKIFKYKGGRLTLNFAVSKMLWSTVGGGEST